MEKVKKSWKKVVASEKFVWFALIIIAITIMRLANMLPESDFVSIFKWAVFGLFGSEGLNQLTNINRTENKKVSDK